MSTTINNAEADDVKLQHRIFDWLKVNAGIKGSMVLELADLWNISPDSVYRRLRGEKLMTLGELMKLYDNYEFSLEDVVSSSNMRLVFSFQPIHEKDFSFVDYLEYIDNMLEKILEGKENRMYYLANDVPLFQLLNSPILASYKLFFWQRTILGFDEYKKEKFNLGEINERVNELSRNIRDNYYKIPSHEMYSPQTIDTTLRQLDFSLESGHFKDPTTALLLCDEFLKLLEHITAQCDTGKKFKAGEKCDRSVNTEYKVYYNEVLYSDTTIMVQSDTKRLVYLTNNGLNVLRTDALPFYEHSMRGFELLRRKSFGISGGNDRERNRIFVGFENRIKQFRKKIEGQINASGL